LILRRILLSLILRRVLLFLAAFVNQLRVTHWRIVKIAKTINLPGLGIKQQKDQKKNKAVKKEWKKLKRIKKKISFCSQIVHFREILWSGDRARPASSSRRQKGSKI
jgi:hypothetical protein